MKNKTKIKKGHYIDPGLGKDLEHCNGTQYKITADYPVKLSCGHTITVPAVEYVECVKCGEQVLPPNTWEKIDAATNRHKSTIECETYERNSQN